MKENPREDWDMPMTPEEKAIFKHCDEAPIEQIRAELVAQGVDVDGFLARIKRKIQTAKETGTWPTD